MPFDPVSFTVEKVGGFLFDAAKREFLRETDIVAYLKKHGIEKLEDRFESVYVNTVATMLLENKPRALLRLFQDKRVVEAFAETWRTNNRVIFSHEVLRAVNELAAGDEIKQAKIDVGLEIENFQLIFRKLVQDARTPGDQEVITRLNEILVEMKKPESFSSILTPFEKFERDLIGWLSALGYSIEGNPIRSENMVEFMLNVPRRRQGYDRVVVHANAGGIKMAHIEDLRSAVKSAKADEGWIVTERRIAQSVREQAKDMEAEHLVAYTLDDLIEDHADFSRYYAWLEKEVKDKELETYFVSLNGRVDDLSPEGQPLGTSHYSDLDKYLEQWLAASDKEHVSILGEFGTGKTWLTLHFAYRLMKEYGEAKVKGMPRPRIPLVIRLSNYAQGFKDVGALLSEFVFREHEIGLPGYGAFEQLNRMGRLLLIFDGFDEMATRVDRQKIVNNFWEIAKQVTPGSKVILTCRTEYFHYASEEREVLSGELKAFTDKIVLEAPKFEVVHLEMFSPTQARKALNRRAKPETVRTIMANSELVDMASRPVLIELILDALVDVQAGKPVDLAHIYYYAVVHKMKRDIKVERTFTSLADKFFFLCELAWEMYTTDQLSLHFRRFPERIRKYFGSKITDQEEDHWHHDLVGQTMLIRDAQGNYKAAHRSLLEFFIAYKLAAEMGALREDFVEAVRNQIDIDLATQPCEYKWSIYFRRNRDEKGLITSIPPLAGFSPEPIEDLARTIGQYQITDSPIHDHKTLPVLRYMRDMTLVKPLWNVIQMTKGYGESAGFTGGNAANILTAKGEQLVGAKLANCVLTGADLAHCDIRGIDLRGCVWHEADMSDGILENANLVNSDLYKLKISEGGCMSVAWSPDERYLASGWCDGSIVIWETRTWQRVAHMRHMPRLWEIRWHPNGDLLLSCGSPGKNNNSKYEAVKVWQTELWTEVFSFSGFSGEPSRNYGRKVYQTVIGDWQDVYRACFDVKRNRIIAISDSGELKALDLGDGKVIREINCNAGLISIGMSPDYKEFTVADRSRILTTFDAETIMPLRKREISFKESWSVTKADGGGLRFYMGGVAGFGSGKRPIRISNPYSSLTYLDNGKTILMTNYDDMLRYLDASTLQTKSRIGTIQTGIRQIGFGLGVSADQRLLAIGAIISKRKDENDEAESFADSYVLLLEVVTKKGLPARAFIRKITGEIKSVSYSPSGKYLATGSSENMSVWEVDPSQPVIKDCIKVLEVPINCRGTKIAGARGLDSSKLRFFYERGAELDKHQLEIIHREFEGNWAEIEQKRNQQ